MHGTLRTIRAGDVDPETIDLAVFEVMSFEAMPDTVIPQRYTLSQIRESAIAGIGLLLPTMRNNAERYRQQGNEERALFVEERIASYSATLQQLLSGEEALFEKKGFKALLPVVAVKAQWEDAPVDAVDVSSVRVSSAVLEMQAHTAQESIPPRESFVSETSMLPALVMVGHAMGHPKHWWSKMVQSFRIGLKQRKRRRRARSIAH